MSSTFERLSAIVAREHKLPIERLSRDASLDSLGIDSLGAVELLWLVEDAFGIKLPAEPPQLATLGDVVQLIDGLLAQQGPA